MVGNQQVVKELLSSQGEQQVKITSGVGSLLRALVGYGGWPSLDLT